MRTVVFIGLVVGVLQLGSGCSRSFCHSAVECEITRQLEEAYNGHRVALILENIKYDELPDIRLEGRELVSFQSGWNDLTKFPAELFDHASLEDISFIADEIQFLPDRFDELPRLKDLSIAGGSVSILPPSIYRLKHLQRLWFPNHRIQTIPDSLAGLVSLSTLCLTGNPIRTLPASIGNLDSLMILDLGGTRLESIPTSMSGLTRLRHLYLNGIPSLDFERTIEVLLPLESLEELYLHENGLRSIPSRLEQFTQLRKLNLQLNPLTKSSVDSLRKLMPNTEIIF